MAINCLVSRIIGAGFLLAFNALPAHSQVYKWVDEQGKIHYSDKKPKNTADDITNQVSKTNIDTSTEEQRKLQQIFRPENDADREYYRQQKANSQVTTEQMRRCNEARNYLRTIDTRVFFFDAEGKEVKVTERERQEKVKSTKEYLEKNCRY